MAQCDKCGNEILKGDQFCRGCGAPVRPDAGEAAPEPPGVDTDQRMLAEKVERRVNQKIGLLWHIGTYVVINAFMVFIWALGSRTSLWFLWVLVPWGVGLAFHVIGYFLGGESGAKERMVKKEMEKIKKEGGSS